MADVAATIAQWSSTTGSNSPSGATNIGSGLDDNLREIQGVIVRGLSHKGADIASATTTDIGAVEGLAHDITGTTTITGLGTVRAGIWKVLKFEGALTLTHNATSLILPGGANITAADGDVAVMISEGAGNWRCVSYVPAVGQVSKGSATTSGLTMNTDRILGRTTASTGAIEELAVGSSLSLAAGALNAALASQAEAQAGTENTKLMTALRVAEAIAALGTQFKVVATTRDVSLASGNVAITGAGFTPKAVIVSGCVGTVGSAVGAVGLGMALSSTERFGISSGANITANSWIFNNARMISLPASSGNQSDVDLVSLDADGCTISYTKTGSPTGTASLSLLFLR